MADLEADYRIVLNSEYQRRVARNAAYSKASFARTLGVDRTYLAKLFGGKILLSLDVADRITQKLKFDPKKRADFLLSVVEEHRCHALYLIAPTLTECDPVLDQQNQEPRSRRRK